MNTEQLILTELKILKSNAGFYIGREYFDEEIGRYLPYSRESDYFRSREEVQKVLSGYFLVKGKINLMKVEQLKVYRDKKNEEIMFCSCLLDGNQHYTGDIRRIPDGVFYKTIAFFSELTQYDQNKHIGIIQGIEKGVFKEIESSIKGEVKVNFLIEVELDIPSLNPKSPSKYLM